MWMPSETLLSRSCSGPARTSWYAGASGSDWPYGSYRSHRGNWSCGDNGSHRSHRGNRPIWRRHWSDWPYGSYRSHRGNRPYGSHWSHRGGWSYGSHWSHRGGWSYGSHWSHRSGWSYGSHRPHRTDRPCRDGSLHGIAGGIFDPCCVRDGRSAAGF